MFYIRYLRSSWVQKTDNPSIRRYINKIESRITNKIKRGCYVELLSTESIKLLGSTKSRITADENG